MGTALTPVTGTEVAQRHAARVPPGTGARATASTSALPFASWTVEQAKQRMQAGLPLGIIAVNRAFVSGDHWQDADGWVGPWPTAAEGASSDDLTAIILLQQQIARTFTSRNVIGEVTTRHVGGVVGRHPTWYCAPREPKYDANGVQADLASDQIRAKREHEARMTLWWNRNRAHAVLREYVTKLLYGTRAALRLFIPRNALRTVEVTVDGTPRRVSQLVVRDLDDALSKIRVMSPEPEVARVITDDDTGVDVGIFITKNDSGQEMAELTFVDEDGRTVLATSVGGVMQGIALDMGGRLTMIDECRPEFITEQVRQSQRALNFANTMIPRNVTTGGFLEEAIINAHVPGHWVEVDGVRDYVPTPILRGPGTAQNWVGIEYEDAQGNKQITTPNVLWRPPVPPTASIEAKKEHERDIISECNQAHTLATGDGAVGWQSRIQARADYAESLRVTAACVDRVGEWLLESVTALAEALSGNVGSVTRDWRFVFQSVLDTGPLTPEERDANRADVEAGLLARGSAMERAGIADADGEIARIDDEQTGDLSREEKRANVFTLWVNAGVGEDVAARRAGLDEAEVKELLASRTDAAVDDGGDDDGDDPPVGENGDDGDDDGDE
jgi:hypothetical protein